jgi:hypothetical protein
MDYLCCDLRVLMVFFLKRPIGNGLRGFVMKDLFVRNPRVV